MGLRCVTMVFWVCLYLFPVAATGQDTAVPLQEGLPASVEETSAIEPDEPEAAIKMLHSITRLRKQILQRLQEKIEELETSSSATQKEQLKSEIAKLDQQMNDSRQDFERIATGIDTSLFTEKKPQEFDWQKELVGLVEPGIKEIKRMTVKARNKAKLKDEQARYQERVPVAHQAVENIRRLIEQTQDPMLKENLSTLLPEWQGLERQLRNRLEIVTMRLEEMEKDEKSFIETSQTSIKNFFKTRGLYLFIAVGTCIGALLLLRLLSRALARVVPGYQARYRPFHIRALSLLFRVFSVFLVLFVIVFVFYMVEDWVLLSLTIIFIMGLGWAVKHTLPQYWHQSRLMLNIGAVREGERFVYQGVPWLVTKINLYSELENPALEVKLRLPIEEFFGKTSRPFHKHEPWFPCKRNDWVILSDGTRGVVTSQTHEMVELIQRGGAKKTYQTSDFLSLSPLNLSVNFRLKVSFGIAYHLQKEATTTILETLESHIAQQLEAEGYQNQLLNLRVEFEQANASSLDLVVIADFDGQLAPLYNRLRRAIQRWCVDACTLNNWEIPFPQLTVHQYS